MVAYAKKPRRPYKRRAYKSRRKPAVKMNSLTTMMKNVALKNCETKKANIYLATAVNLFHNLAYYATNLLATRQGLGNPEGMTEGSRNRVGDEVIARGLKIKWFMQNEADRPNVMYRIIVFRYNTLAGTPGPITDNYFWCGTDGEGGNMNRMLDRPNTERVKVIKEILVKPTNQANYSIQTAGPVPVGPFSKTNIAECWIPLNNRKIKYNNDDSPLVRFTDIGFAVTVYDAIGTAQTDNIADMQWTSTFYFKDP